MTKATVTFHALYSDGATYRVMYDASERQTYLATVEGGFMSVPRFVNGAEFVHYDFNYQPQPGLRGCDVGDNMRRLHASLSLLMPPAKPTVLPTPIQQPEDFRLHIEPDTNSFRALQAAGARGEQEYREDRQRARQQALQTMNQPTTTQVRKTQAARAAASDALHARQRPK